MKRLARLGWHAGGPTNRAAADVSMTKASARRILLAVFAVALVSIAAPAWLPAVITTPPVVLAMTFVPGGLVVLMLYDDVSIAARTVLYALGLSLVLLLGMGFVVNLTLPAFGISRPMSVVSLTISLTVLVGLLVLATRQVDLSRSVTFQSPLPLSPTILFVAILPLGSIIAVSYLNTSGSNGPLLVVLSLIAVTPLAAVVVLERRWHGYAVWLIAISVLYHKALLGSFGFSGSPGVIRAWQAGRWTPGVTEVHPYSTELLQNGVLYPTYAILSKITIITELEVVNPFLIAFIPLAVFVAVRRYFGSRLGLIAASLFAFAHPFYIQYPTGGRAATPVLFLALFAVVLTDDRLPAPTATTLSILFASGVVVSHYGTSYFVMFAFIGALVLLLAVRVLDWLSLRFGIPTATDGGADDADDRWSRLTPGGSGTVLTWQLAAFVAVGAISWYMFATQGQKFKTLPNHVVRSASSLMGGSVVEGRTGARLARDYGGLSITLSKIIYLGLGLLMGLGIAYVFYRRYFRDDRSIVDHRYLALSTVMLGIFGLTFVAQTWGGGRPMMITLTFTSAFAAFGGAVLVTVLSGIVKRLRGDSSTGISLAETRSSGAGIVGIVLVALFVLNSGIASAVALGGSSPSSAPDYDPAEDHKAIDIGTHVWVSDHGHGNAIGDPTTHGQTDWYLPGIALQSRSDVDYSNVNKPRGSLVDGLDPGDSGYVMLLSHNIKEGAVDRQYTEDDIPLSEYESELDRRHKIFSTKLSAVYYTSNASEGVSE